MTDRATQSVAVTMEELKRRLATGLPQPAFLPTETVELWYVDETGAESEDFESYADACDYVNLRCDELESDGWSVDRGWASSGNYYAACATLRMNVVMIAVERVDV